MQHTYTNKCDSLSSKTRAGFTLVELMVTISILAVISAIVFVNHVSFRDSISVTNLVYDIALSVREMQSFGLNSRGNEGGFGLGYGVQFRSDNIDRYSTYVNLDEFPGPTMGEEIIERYYLQEGNEITNICVTVTTGSVAPGEHCSQEDGLIAFYALYERPNPEPYMRSNIGFISEATVTIGSPNGNIRHVYLNEAGQISVLQQ